MYACSIDDEHSSSSHISQNNDPFTQSIARDYMDVLASVEDLGFGKGGSRYKSASEILKTTPTFAVGHAYFDRI